MTICAKTAATTTAIRGKPRFRSSAFRSRPRAKSRARTEGIIVTDVDTKVRPRARLRTGDVILEIGGRNVTRVNDLDDALVKARREGKSVILLRVKSQGGTRYVTLPVGKG